MLRMPKEMKAQLRKIKNEEDKPYSVVIREAIQSYFWEREQKNALQWFINTNCGHCWLGCTAGSIRMIECMCKKLNQKSKPEEGAK